MEDLQLFDFMVKSIIHDYKLQFVDSSIDVLEKEIKDGDVILMDQNIIDLYPSIFELVSQKNLLVSINASEKQKSYESLIPIINKLIESGFRKNHRLIGIGGGITQDITGFISSIMYRGVDWIFFPTTLLAQGDSCIGSKTSVNFGEYKNQVGGFYPPKNIYIDLNFLDSLSFADMQSGFGEMCHYFVVAGKTDYLKYKNDYEVAIKNKFILKSMIARSLAIKKNYIEIE